MGDDEKTILREVGYIRDEIKEVRASVGRVHARMDETDKRVQANTTAVAVLQEQRRASPAKAWITAATGVLLALGGALWMIFKH